jgi:hypothetical protein
MISRVVLQILIKKEAVNCCIPFIHDEKGAMVFYDLHSMMVFIIAMQELKVLPPPTDQG